MFVRENVANKGGNPICDVDLLDQAAQNETYATRKLINVERSRLPEGWKKPAGSLYRTGDQLWEVRDIQAEIHKVVARVDLVSIQVDGVAHRLKRVERDSDWQHDIEMKESCVDSG